MRQKRNRNKTRWREDNRLEEDRTNNVEKHYYQIQRECRIKPNSQDFTLFSSRLWPHKPYSTIIQFKFKQKFFHFVHGSDDIQQYLFRSLSKNLLRCEDIPLLNILWVLALPGSPCDLLWFYYISGEYCEARAVISFVSKKYKTFSPSCKQTPSESIADIHQ